MIEGFIAAPLIVQYRLPPRLGRDFTFIFNEIGNRPACVSNVIDVEPVLEIRTENRVSADAGVKRTVKVSGPLQFCDS